MATQNWVIVGFERAGTMTTAAGADFYAKGLPAYLRAAIPAIDDDPWYVVTFYAAEETGGSIPFWVG